MAERRENDQRRVAKFPDRETAVASLTAMARSGALKATSPRSAAEGAAERQAVHTEADRQSGLQPPNNKDRGKAYDKAAKNVQAKQDSSW